MQSEPNYLIMELTEGYLGEHGSVFNVHSLGYAELCEQYTEQFNTPWFCETFGIISDDIVKLISLEDNGNLICELTKNEFGLITPEFWFRENKFVEELTDCYAYRLGFLKGIEEFEGEIEIDKLRSMISLDPLELHKPFQNYGYFEKLSKIENSRNNLMELLKNNH